MSHHPRALLSSLAAVLWACGDDAGRDEAGETTPPPPATTAAPDTTTTATDVGATTTGPAPSGCDCASGEYCAAPHQTGVIAPDDDALVYGCRAECVPAEDPSVWCRADVPSCCAGLSCDDHGFCVDPDAVDPTTGSGSGSETGTTRGDSGTTTDDSTSDDGTATGATDSGSGTAATDTGSTGSTTGG